MTSTTRAGQIVAMGGGGFSVGPEPQLIDDFILSLAPKQPAKICFVPGASAESAAYLVKFYRAFSGRALTTDLTIFDPPAMPRRPSSTADLSSFLDEQDIIYVGGGNTANLLAMWRVHGLDKLLLKAWNRGAILCGVSAGMICWFRGGVTDSFGPLAALNDGLGLIDATACPHYDGEINRRPTYHRLIKDGFQWGFAADDGAALHFQGTELKEAVGWKDSAAAYRVQLVDGQVVESRLPTRLLGN